MVGTIVNTCCIIAGSIAGSILRRGIKEKYREALFTALGVCTLLLGANAFVHNMPKSRYPVLFIVAMAIGSAAGCAMKLERIRDFGTKKKAEQPDDCSASVGRTDAEKPRLADGLTTGCLLYCIGTFSMLGPVMAALQEDHTYLFTNAALDLVSSTVLAATYGIGMVWAAPVLFCSQGLFYLIARCSASAISPELMTELSIIGGILIAASGIDILKLRNCHTLQMLPALLVPPLFFLVKSLF
ncbi:MAG: DUF554 domain-containing protein [Prevotella sp.]|nr:DUF554 domain-containing protein [Prevotella sp.]